jgi:hypothetical protein
MPVRWVFGVDARPVTQSCHMPRRVPHTPPCLRPRRSSCPARAGCSFLRKWPSNSPCPTRTGPRRPAYWYTPSPWNYPTWKGGCSACTARQTVQQGVARGRRPRVSAGGQGPVKTRHETLHEARCGSSSASSRTETQKGRKAEKGRKLRWRQQVLYSALTLEPPVLRSHSCNRSLQSAWHKRV